MDIKIKEKNSDWRCKIKSAKLGPGLGLNPHQEKFCINNIYPQKRPASINILHSHQMRVSLYFFYSIVKDSSVYLEVNLMIVLNRPTVKAVSTKISKKSANFQPGPLMIMGPFWTYSHHCP